MTKTYGNNPDLIYQDYNDCPAPKYTWNVELQMQTIVVQVEADNAEDAMEIANNYDLMGRKGVSLDDIPDLFPVSADITGITKAFKNVMSEYKNDK